MYNNFTEEASCIMQDIDNEEALTHWIWEQDFFIDNEDGTETGSPLPDDVVSSYLIAAGANNIQVESVLKIIHQED